MPACKAGFAARENSSTATDLPPVRRMPFLAYLSRAGRLSVEGDRRDGAIDGCRSRAAIANAKCDVAFTRADTIREVLLVL
jgi:hypothetical protein